MSAAGSSKGSRRASASLAQQEDAEKAAARRQAEWLLRQAAQWLMATHPHGLPLERAPRDRYSHGVVIRFDPPGVLRVFDWHDGQLRAESVVGAPDLLSPAFAAPAPRT